MVNEVRSKASLVALAGALSMIVACSANPRDESADGESASALRTLSASEIKGEIHYGENRTLHYAQSAGAARYVALSFEASANDVVDIWVRANGDGDARLWLTDDAFKNVATNDNASSSAKDSHLTHTIARAGTYYIAVRDANFEDGDFTVSLAKSNDVNACDPEIDECPYIPFDPFDPSSCSGPAMTVGEARARFPAGTSSVSLGASRMVARRRFCHDQTGCGAWMASNVAPFGSAHTCNHIAGWNADFTNAPTNVSVPSSGTVTLKAASDHFEMDLGLRPFVLSKGSTFASWSDPATQSASLGPFITASDYMSGCENVTIIGRDNVNGRADSARFSGVVTKSCLRGTATGRVYDRSTGTAPDGTGRYVETEVVVYAAY